MSDNINVQETTLKQTLDEKTKEFAKLLAEAKKEKESLESLHKEAVVKLQNEIKNAKVLFAYSKLK